MSHIPTSAMPKAGPSSAEAGEKDGGGRSIKKQAGKIAEKARDNPKAAIAAGAVVAGVVAAAAAIPLVRAASAKKSDKKDGGSGGSKKKKKG